MAAKKNALGRGLGALIDSEEEKEQIVRSVAGISEIPVDQIETNPFQPRTGIDEESLADLASSIAKLGIIQPITVRELAENRYQIITGERRWRAAKLAGLETIPAYVRKADDQGMLEMALVENIQREDLNAIEVAISYQRLIEECKLTQEMLSERVGKNRATISNYLRLLKLPAEIQLGLRENRLSMGHARALITLEDQEILMKIYNKIIHEDLSVRKTEALVKKLTEPKPSEEQTKEVPTAYNDLQEHLSRFFEIPVEFKRNNKGNGRIVLHFRNDEELEKILAILDRLNR